MNAEPRHIHGSEADPPAVDVVIVNWNTAGQALRAAAAYRESRGVETRVVIVDNDSAAQEKERLRAAVDAGDPAFELIEAGRNLGFGTAANLGLKEGSSPFVLVSNADVSPEPEAVAALCRAAESSDSGMIAPAFADDQRNYHNDLPGPLTLLVRTFVGSFGSRSIPQPEPGTTEAVEQPAGACFLMRRDLWDEAGGFEESFFLWYEDVDLARRLHDAGHSGMIVGDARVRHLGGESFARLDPRTKQAIRLASLARYIRLHHPVTYVLARPLLWLSLQVRAGKSGKTGAASRLRNPGDARA